MSRKLLKTFAVTLKPHYTLVMAVGVAQKPSDTRQTKHCIAKVVTVILMRCGRVEGVPGELCLETHHFLRNLPMGKTTPLVMDDLVGRTLSRGDLVIVFSFFSWVAKIQLNH